MMENLFGIDRNAPIFRIITKARLLDVLKRRELTLVRPAKWDDPFENFLLQCRVELAGGLTASLEGMREQLYGQCWTMLQESDAMWRIYAPTKDGVKIRSTAGKLYDAIYDPRNDFAPLSYYLGKVEYYEEQDIIDLISDPKRSGALVFDSSGKGQVHALLIKRLEFAHEEEVRLIYRSNVSGGPDTVSFSVDPNDLFEEMTIDPRLSDADAQLLTEELRRHGYSGPVAQSGLYRLPSLTIKAGI